MLRKFDPTAQRPTVIDGRMRNLATNHADPWALVRRGGSRPGARPSTRLVYLVGTLVPAGQAQAVAMTGFVIEAGGTWTRHTRRIEWADIVRRWPRQPTERQIAAAKRGMAKTPARSPSLPTL